MNTTFMIRQGDIMVVSVDAIPNDTVVVPRDADGAVTLAHGEATGHKHCLREEGVTMLRAANDAVFLRVLEPAQLRHEEHTHIRIPPGLYRVVRQRQWTDAEEPIQVAD